MKRLVSGIMLTLLLTSMLTLAFNIQPVKAEGTIYIRADGSIDPPTAPISTFDNVTYTLTGNITSDAHGIVVLRSNIVIDGAGYTLQGIGALSTGIHVENGSNVTIKNARIKGFDSGISFFGYTPALKFSKVVGNYIINCSNGILGGGFSYNIAGNNIINNTWGVKLFASSNNTIVGNNIIANDKGITLWDGSSNDSIFGNTMESNSYGIMFVYGSSDNKIFHNNFVNNNIQVYSSDSANIWDDGYPSGGNYWSDYTGVDADGDGIGDTPYVIDTDNQDRYPLMHLWSPLPVHNINTGLGYATIQGAIDAPETLNGHTIVVDGGVFYENIVISKSLILMGQGNNLTIIDGCGKGDAIYLKANNTRVKGFAVRNGVNGFEMAPWTSGHVIEDNIVLYNDQGISGHYDCKNITVCNNTITLSNVCGVRMLFSNSTISNNLICNNGNADNWLWSSGIEIVMGVGPADIYCINNTIVGNTIRDNNYGIWAIRYSVNNTFIHNSFINNTKQICGSMNMHNDTFLENYWSDYNGTDSNGDGIGDTPYIIDGNNIDRYPLMNPYGVPPPPTYTLTITTTVGGTTDPSPGIYSYTANSTIQVTAIPEANYLFDYCELDGVNVGSANPYSVLMDKNHVLKAVFSPIPPPLSVSTSPLSASILVGQSVTFTSTVSGGYPPYTYQWYLNSVPVSGANASSWTFTPTASGIYYIYLKVTDAKGNAAQSETARIAVTAVPVGGYSIQIQVHTNTEPVLPYIALIAALTATFTKLRPKTKRKR